MRQARWLTVLLVCVGQAHCDRPSPPTTGQPASAAAVETGAVGEIQLTDGLDALAKREPVFAYRFEGERFDAGTPLGLIETAVELALRRPDMADELGPWIKDLAKRIDKGTAPSTSSGQARDPLASSNRDIDERG